MNGRLVLVFFLGFLLLSYSFGKKTRPPLKQETRSSFTLNRYKEILSEFKSRGNAALLNAFVSGNKSNIPKSTKVLFERLNLLHLFTPSGIHLSALLIPTFFFFRQSKFKTFILVPLFLISYFCTPYHSIKRMLLVKSIYSTKKLSLFHSFFIAFGVDFIFGTFQQNPLSFSYSFLFLGIILSFINRPKIYLPFALFGGQLISCFFTSSPLFITGFFWSFLLTSLFSVFYPLFFIFFWFPQTPGAESLIATYSKLVNLSYNLADLTGAIYPGLPIIALVFYLGLGQRKPIIIITLLYLNSAPLLNSLKSIKKGNDHKRTYKIIERKNYGYKTWHSDRVCLHRHTLSDYEINCRLSQ